VEQGGNNEDFGQLELKHAFELFERRSAVRPSFFVVDDG
jgi:hypothetical protein